MSSSAFHPATIGALYGVLAQHEQALAQWALAEKLATGTTDGETADRYAAVVGDVKRLIALAEPGPQGAPIEGLEQFMRGHELLGRLLSQLSDYQLNSLDLGRDRRIRAMLHRGDGGSRRAMRDIADRLGVTYGSRVFDPTGGTEEYVTASGQIDGFDVEIWTILPIEQQADHAAGIACSESPCPICVELQEQKQQGTAEPAGDAQ